MGFAGEEQAKWAAVDHWLSVSLIPLRFLHSSAGADEEPDWATAQILSCRWRDFSHIVSNHGNADWIAFAFQLTQIADQFDNLQYLVSSSTYGLTSNNKKIVSYFIQLCFCHLSIMSAVIVLSRKDITDRILFLDRFFSPRLLGELMWPEGTGVINKSEKKNMN